MIRGWFRSPNRANHTQSGLRGATNQPRDTLSLTQLHSSHSQTKPALRMQTDIHLQTQVYRDINHLWGPHYHGLICVFPFSPRHGSVTVIMSSITRPNFGCDVVQVYSSYCTIIASLVRSKRRRARAHTRRSAAPVDEHSTHRAQAPWPPRMACSPQATRSHGVRFVRCCSSRVSSRRPTQAA